MESEISPPTRGLFDPPRRTIGIFDTTPLSFSERCILNSNRAYPIIVSLTLVTVGTLLTAKAANIHGLAIGAIAGILLFSIPARILIQHLRQKFEKRSTGEALTLAIGCCTTLIIQTIALIALIGKNNTMAFAIGFHSIMFTFAFIKPEELGLINPRH